ncbi:hypothetical protein P8452_22078 [Trifolium repens]|nr:hypothetical protein P8452_22078 [Trifolium repens]
MNNLTILSISISDFQREYCFCYCAGVYLKAFDIILEKTIPSVSLCPCRFKLARQENVVEKDGLDDFHSHRNYTDDKLHGKATSGVFLDTINWSMHSEVVAALSDESRYKEEEEVANQS